MYTTTIHSLFPAQVEKKTSSKGKKKRSRRTHSRKITSAMQLVVLQDWLGDRRSQSLKNEDMPTLMSAMHLALTKSFRDASKLAKVYRYHLGNLMTLLAFNFQEKCAILPNLRFF